MSECIKGKMSGGWHSVCLCDKCRELPQSTYIPHETNAVEKWKERCLELRQRLASAEKVVEAFKDLRKSPIICDLNGNYGDECSSSCIFIEICGILRHHDEGREEGSDGSDT